VPAGSDLPRPGDVVTVRITQAAPHHLIADATDGAPLRIRRTRAGDAWDRAQALALDPHAGSDHGHGGAPAGPVSIGLPTIRVGA
jgi:tRNA-2-methylthio-N6-dimethylallyladenosine synthase